MDRRDSLLCFIASPSHKHVPNIEVVPWQWGEMHLWHSMKHQSNIATLGIEPSPAGYDSLNKKHTPEDQVKNKYIWKYTSVNAGL